VIAVSVQWLWFGQPGLDSLQGQGFLSLTLDPDWQWGSLPGSKAGGA